MSTVRVGFGTLLYRQKAVTHSRFESSGDSDIMGKNLLFVKFTILVTNVSKLMRLIFILLISSLLFESNRGVILIVTL